MPSEGAAWVPRLSSRRSRLPSPSCQREHRRLRQHTGFEKVRTLQARHDLPVADAQQLAIQRIPFGMPRFLAGAEIRARIFEGGNRVGVGNALAGGFVGELGKLGELVAPPFAHCIGQFAVVAGEEQEWLARPHSSPMNNSGTMGDSSSTAVAARNASASARLTGARRRRGCRSDHGSAGTARRRSAADGRWARHVLHRDDCSAPGR